MQWSFLSWRRNWTTCAEQRGIWRSDSSEVFWRQSGVFRDASEHSRSEFVGIIECPSVIGKLRMRQLMVGTTLFMGALFLPSNSC
jgi:hypothetical protein